MTFKDEEQPSPDSLYVQKQCVNCRKFYKEIENNYVPPSHTTHTSTHAEGSSASQKPICFFHRSASCCVYSEINGDAIIPKGTLNPGVVSKAKGCIQALHHVEDKGYSALISKFPVHTDTLEIMRQTHATTRIGAGGDNEDDDSVNADNEQYLVHRVALTDTLMGISLYYHVKINDIQRANNLTSHQIFHKKVLRIPRPNVVIRPMEAPAQSEEHAKKRKEKQLGIFCQMTSCNREEAVYYMEMCDFHIDEAIKEWKADAEWAQSNEKRALAPNNRQSYTRVSGSSGGGGSGVRGLSATRGKARKCC